jgi:hypothetical protein
VIGRISRTTVNSQVPDSVAGVVSQGTLPAAKANPASPTPTPAPVPINTVMSILVDLLLSD